MAQAKVAQSGGLLREEATAYAAKLDTFSVDNPITYVPPGYSKAAMSAGGFVSLDAENDLATKFLGYSGEKSRTALDSFYKANPSAAARMGKYQQAMKQFATGGMVRGLKEQKQQQVQ